VQEKLREQIGQQLLEKYPFDLPFTLIEKETNFRMQHLLRDSMFYQQWSRMDEEHRKKTVQSVFDQSQKAVRMFYLCRKITEDANIQVRPQDLAKGPATTLEALLQPSSQYQLSEQKEVQQAEAFSRLLLEKAEDYLIAHATMK
jgi:trigger factor